MMNDIWLGFQDEDDWYCDCPDEEIDPIEGRAKCWSCGRSRSLSSSEMKEALEVDAYAQEMWAEEMQRTTKEPTE